MKTEGKSVLIISTSPREGSNSELLASEFAKGAVQSGHKVELISLRGKDIKFCRGCFACQKTQRCVIRDDADLIEQKMEKADVLVFATPIYYYEMSGQMKTILDRGNPLYTTNYAFRDVYLICSAAENEDHVWERARKGLEGWIECFPKARLAGCVFGGDVTEVKDVIGNPAMEEAYKMGKNI